jgi:glycosyltransferase involved in cell wall biosynthesis
MKLEAALRIFINGRFLTQPITGVQRYAAELIKFWDQMIEQRLIDSSRDTFILLIPRKIKYNLALKHIQIKKVGLLNGHLWEQLELPFHTCRGVLINLCNTAPIFKRKQMVTIHDAAVFGYPQAYSASFRNWYRFLFRMLGKTTKLILTDSIFSQSELVKYCNIKPNKLRVVYLGREHILGVQSSDTILNQYDLTGRKYVLAVSSMSPNKNFFNIVKALELLGNVSFPIVIAGGVNPRVFAGTFRLPESISHVGYVNDEELKTLYEHAACFIYPSFYEGFGLPPLEAMVCGCPVIVSQTASLPEVCQEAALYCDPNSPQNIAFQIKRILEDDILRESLKKKGLERAKQFSWGKCAEETYQAIQEAF